MAAGDLICKLDDQGRHAALRAAQAAVERADLEHRGVVSLKRGGFQSDLAIARALAELQAARSALAVAWGARSDGVRTSMDGSRALAT